MKEKGAEKERMTSEGGSQCSSMCNLKRAKEGLMKKKQKRGGKFVKFVLCFPWYGGDDRC